MKKTIEFNPLFEKFIRDSTSGKRLKKNGERILPQSITNYRQVFKNIIEFSKSKNIELRICDANKLNKREFEAEKNYWKRFYKNFSHFLYKKGCYDNYVGLNFKTIRTFFNYLKTDQNINTGDFQKIFYVRKEVIEILVLSPEQLKFLIHNDNFHNSLSQKQKLIKDIFVFGCTTGLRYSDIKLLTNKNFTKTENTYYLKVKSKKTKSLSQIKLPDYASSIYLKYNSNSSKNKVFDAPSLNYFNEVLKEIGKKAKFVNPINVSREIQGRVKTKRKETQFYEKMSSHMMRRTAITTLLILGMPEHLVRKISGHSAESNSFHKYVHYSKVYTDKELDKVYHQLETQT